MLSRARIRPPLGRPLLASNARARPAIRDVRNPFARAAASPQKLAEIGIRSVRRRSYSTEEFPQEGEGPQVGDQPDDVFCSNILSEIDYYEEAQLMDDEDRKRLGLFRPPFLLGDESRTMNWYQDFRSLSDVRFRQGQGTFLYPSSADEKSVPPDPDKVTPRPALIGYGKKAKRSLRRLWPQKGRRLLLYWFMADNMAKFPLEPAFQEEIWDYDYQADEHPMHGKINTMRVHRDMNVYLGNIPTRNQTLSKNFLVEKARRFYMPTEQGGFTPVVGPMIATPDEQAEKNYKGVPFLEMKDVPLTAMSPHQPQLWTRIQEQFNDSLFRRDWRPPATMAWDPLMNYAVPFWQEPKLRRPTGAARTWSWKHHPANEPQMRNLFYGPAMMNTFDRALAGSDRLDLPGYSRLDDPEKMTWGHRREMRKENAAVARYQRSILNDEYDRKAEEMWSRGTIAGDRGPVHYDRRPQISFKRRWIGLALLLFVVYLMWITGTASDKYIAEENWYQHPIVHDRARFHGFRVREMKVNGRGFWHAVADQLYGTPDVWQWVMRAFAFQFDGDAFKRMSAFPIGDPQDGTTLLDFYNKVRLSDVNWVKMWVRNLPGDFDDDYRNMEWTGRPGQTMSYYDMSPDYEAMRVEINEHSSDFLPKVDTKRFHGEEEEEEDYDELEHYEESLMQMYHPMDHIDMFYAATVMNIRINLLSTCYTIPHHKAWIHIDPANGAVPRYEVNLLMHYVNGDIIGFDSLVPYEQKEWHGVAMDPVKIAKRKAKEDLPGRMAADLASSFKSYVDNRMAAIEAEEREAAFNAAWESSANA